MSETVKIIIEIPELMYQNIQNGMYCGSAYPYLRVATPLDDVKAEITALRYGSDTYKNAIDDVIEILDSVGRK